MNPILCFIIRAVKNTPSAKSCSAAGINDRRPTYYSEKLGKEGIP